MTWRATTFGPELRGRREQARMTQLELARCLRRHGFASARAPTDADVAAGIAQIEAGGEYPFEEGHLHEQQFLFAVVACVCDREDVECAQSLCDAMCSDILDSSGI